MKNMKVLSFLGTCTHGLELDSESLGLKRGGGTIQCNCIKSVYYVATKGQTLVLVCNQKSLHARITHYLLRIIVSMKLKKQ